MSCIHFWFEGDVSNFDLFDWNVEEIGGNDTNHCANVSASGSTRYPVIWLDDVWYLVVLYVR